MGHGSGPNRANHGGVVTALAVAAALGVVGGFLGRWSTAPALASPALMRTNYRGRLLPTASGLAVVVGVLAAEAALALTSDVGWPDALDALDADTVPGAAAARAASVVAVVGFALLGLVDDVAGQGESGGFRRHLRSLASARPTSGALKLVGGPLVGLVAVGLVAGVSGWRLLADAALVALSANLVNLFDRAPGRALKVGLVWVVAAGCLAGSPDLLVGPAIAAGAAAVLLWPDLRESSMLGDTGANAVGAVAGLALVLGTSAGVRTIALVAVAALNLASEAVSFSQTIERVSVLRALDRLGAPHRRHPG